MARAYSDDLRKKLLEAHAFGKGTLRELAERFGVSVGWAFKVSAAKRQTGSSLRTPQRRAPSRIDGERVRRLVENKPDIILRELQAELGRAGQPISLAHMARVVKQLGLRLKKSRSTPPSATPKLTGSGAKRSSNSSARSRPKT
ncbi:MAG: hypothetical protein ABI147_08040 [Acidobacteriaceae bacterium]